MKWLRLYTETRRDPKIRRIPVSYRWTWITILCMARESPKPGYLLLRKGMPACSTDIADEANVPEQDAARAIELFLSQAYEMLVEEDGVLRVRNWNRRQYESDRSALRTRQYRERKSRQAQLQDSESRHCDGVSDAGGDGPCDGGGDGTKPSQLPAILPWNGCSDPGSLMSEGSFGEAKCSSKSENARCHEDLHVSRSGCDDGGDASGDVTVTAAVTPLQNYRVTEIESTISKADISVRRLSAFSPQSGTEGAIATSSAPDGAAHLYERICIEGANVGALRQYPGLSEAEPAKPIGHKLRFSERNQGSLCALGRSSGTQPVRAERSKLRLWRGKVMGKKQLFGSSSVKNVNSQVTDFAVIKSCFLRGIEARTDNSTSELGGALRSPFDTSGRTVSQHFPTCTRASLEAMPLTRWPGSLKSMKA